MEVFGFGFNGHSQISDLIGGRLSYSTENVRKPLKLAVGPSFEILWASWCDLALLIKPTSVRDIAPVGFLRYSGSGLTTSQADTVRSHATVPETCFFGSALGHGMEGLVSRINAKTTVTFFSELSGPPNKDPAHEKKSSLADDTVRAVSMTSGGHISVCIEDNLRASIPSSTAGSLLGYTPGSRVYHFSSLAAFQEWIGLASDKKHQEQHVRLSDIPIQLISNATTTTALLANGEVFTSTHDPRYPGLLGRPPIEDGTEPYSTLSPVQYLSETPIRKIATGGYMTAAISRSGELFLWGQACPGTTGELNVLKSKLPEQRHGSDDGDEGDEYVRVANVLIDGKEARVTDVAIGCGHVLVAAEREEGGEIFRAVFAAGPNDSGQLGIGEASDFAEDFVEVEEFRGSKIVQLTAAGWSSWVIARTDGTAQCTCAFGSDDDGDTIDD